MKPVPPGGPQAARPLRIDVEDGPGFEMAAGDDALLRAALRAGLAFPYECSVGGCGACRYELVDGEVETLWAEAPGLSERERRRGKRLACQSKPLGDCRIRVRLGASADAATPLPHRGTATLVTRRPVTADMAEFTFAIDGPTAFHPGQYALLHLPGVPGARAYSMTHAPDATGQWRFMVRRVPGGRGSHALFETLAPGAGIGVDGPFGHAWLRPGERDVVCIAGGSGLGPMLSVARGVLARADHRKVRFFLGLRTQDELAAAAELQALDPRRLQLTTVLSSPTAGSAWPGATGFVHTAVERELAAPLDRFDHYLAGPPPMVEAIQDLLMTRHRVPVGQVRFDRFV